MNEKQYFEDLSSAATVLSMKWCPKGMASRAVAALSSAFVDVNLPDEPMPLDARAAKELRREIAAEIAAHFETAARTAEHGWDETDMENLAHTLDPLWVALAATCWNQVRDVEHARSVRAREVVSAIAKAARDDDFDEREALEAIREELLEGGPEARDAFAVLGLGTRHALAAINDALETSW